MICRGNGTDDGNQYSGLRVILEELYYQNHPDDKTLHPEPVLVEREGISGKSQTFLSNKVLKGEQRSGFHVTIRTSYPHVHTKA